MATDTAIGDATAKRQTAKKSTVSAITLDWPALMPATVATAATKRERSAVQSTVVTMRHPEADHPL